MRGIPRLTPDGCLAIIDAVITTLSKSPLSRLPPLRRVPFWAQAAALCALFAIVGIAVLDDYGIGRDEPLQRRIADANAGYIITGATNDLYHRDFRYYGIALEMPLLLAERALRLQDTRHIHLTRHLLTHLFFIAGGFACGMIAYRMIGSRWIALLAMMMFLLHPRLYAHSFFNSKDVPFAVMLVIALYLAHRAFRKDTLGAFLLCGIGVGLAINLRPFGLMLLPIIPAMRVPDLWQASGAERKRILMTGAVFAAAALGTVYIIHPYYWENPLRLIEGMRVMLFQHPATAENLFMGEIRLSDDVPWNYIPVWFAITAPPMTLPLGVLGAMGVCWQAITRPIAALRDRETRFRILSLGCIVLPVAAIIILQANAQNGWRHVYFLWGPFCLLAAIGLHSVVNNNAGKGKWKIVALLPGWIRGGGPRRTLAYGVAGFGLITTLTAMAALHPHQQVYFSALVDTKTTGALGKRYDMDYWLLAQRQSLEYLLARYPDDVLRVWPGNDSALILPENDRERIVFSSPRDADFYLNPRIKRRNIPDQPTFHSIQAYGSSLAFILAPNSDAYRSAHRAAYNDVATNGTLLARSVFDIYIYNGELYYLNASCAPVLANAGFRIFLHTFPDDPADLPADSREIGFENRDFWITDRFAFFEGKCIHRLPLSDYPITRIRTGQNAAAAGGAEWRVDVNLVARAAAQAVYDSIAAGDYGLSVAQSHFDVYMRGNRLAYLKENCGAGDIDARFFLHIFPADPADLPSDRREHGFENMDFQFADHGAYIGDKCVAELALPDYAIERIRTGQFISGEGQLWSVEFLVRQ